MIAIIAPKKANTTLLLLNTDLKLIDYKKISSYGVKSLTATSSSALGSITLYTINNTRK